MKKLTQDEIIALMTLILRRRDELENMMAEDIEKGWKDLYVKNKEKDDELAVIYDKLFKIASSY